MIKRITAPVVELFDVIEDGPPAVGSQVWALGAGGKLVETVWTRTSDTFFYAWCAYPKVKPVTKERMMQQYKVKYED